MMDKQNMTEGAQASKSNRIKKFLPLLILLFGLILFFALGGNHYISEVLLSTHHQTLTRWVENYPILTSLVFCLAYMIMVLFSLPGGTLMSVAGGFLFGPFYAAFLVVFSATAGATGLFLAAKSSIGDSLRTKAGPWMSRLEAGFKNNELSYLLFLRLVPAFPFFVVNLVPAFLGVGIRTYIIGTFIGIIPGALVFTYFGAGLGKVFESGKAFRLSSVVTPEILIALSGLAILALLPVLFKKMRGK